MKINHNYEYNNVCEVQCQSLIIDYRHLSETQTLILQDDKEITSTYYNFWVLLCLLHILKKIYIYNICFDEILKLDFEQLLIIIVIFGQWLV